MLTKVVSAMARATKGMVRFMGSASKKFLFKLLYASYKKLKLKSPLKTSSVKRVQYLINLEDPLSPNETINRDVQRPTQV